MKQKAHEYSGTGANQVLYLPTDWQLGRGYPEIVEHAGSSHYRNM
jgi:hypothetical protein